MRWFEDPAAVGLRLVGFADAIISLQHTGHYANNFQDSLIRGIVYQLPATHGRERYLHGYADPYIDGAACLCVDVSDDRAAEVEREHQAKEDAKLLVEESEERITEIRRSTLDLLASIRMIREGLDEMPAAFALLCDEVTRRPSTITDLRDRRDRL